MKPDAKPFRRAAPQLSIRSEYAVKRARELARQTGLTTTKIVEDALRRYSVESSGSERAKDERWAKIQEIIDEAAKHGPYPSMKEIDDEMYDEWGLPR